jgi:hypothetical protein
MDCLEGFRRTILSALGCGMLTLGLAATTQAQASCQLNSPTGTLKHVVYIEFDNVHFTRDNPNVPSDLEQMPNLLNFLKTKGTLDAGDHTVLISHTANDILTTEIGLYSDNTGIFIANSFGYLEPGGAFLDFPSAFFYWTDKVVDINKFTNDNNFALTTPQGNNVPAPWVPFTRAGCDVGAFSTANIVLERTPFDVKKVFGANSTQAAESGGQQFNDFVGAAIHCAIASTICTEANGAVADVLPDEPHGYNGYQALFGLKYIAPALGGLSDYSGNAITGFNNIGFDPTPAQTLSVVETMLKKNIPIVFAYIADAHDNHSSEGTFGPGEAGYTKQLADYNAAFGTFFGNMKADGFDETNTLFIFTPDEGDHFVGGTPTPAGCDGATVVNGVVTPDVPCTYGTNGVGEVQYDLGAAAVAAGNTTPFDYHFDDSATTWVLGTPTVAAVRGLEQTLAGLSAVNPHTGMSESLLGNGLGPDLQGALVDQVGQKLLHMDSTLDPARNPTFTLFGNPNFFFQVNGNTIPVVGTGFAWNHGDIQPEIGRTFIGIVGPGVANLGVTGPHDFFTDHVDVRPTMMFLTGLADDYQHDGRVITEVIDRDVLPSSMRKSGFLLEALGQTYKQINAPFGQLAENTLKVSTFALTSNTAGDVTYTNLENLISLWTAQRDALAAQTKSMLEGAEFNGQPINDLKALFIILDGQALLFESDFCAANPARCAKF